MRAASKNDSTFIKPFRLAGISNGITDYNRLAIVFDAIFTSTLSNEIGLQFLRNKKLKSFSWYKHALVLFMLCVGFRFFRFFSRIFLHYFFSPFLFRFCTCTFSIIYFYPISRLFSIVMMTIIILRYFIKRPFPRVQRR